MRIKRKTLLGACSLVASCILVGAGMQSAMAEDEVNLESADSIAAHVVAVAPDGAETAGASQQGDVVTAVAKGTNVSIPLDGGAFDVLANVDGRDLAASISLPAGVALEEGELAADGAVVYQERGGSESAGAVVVQALENGNTRVQTVIADPSATHSFEYAMDGFTPALDGQGGAIFISNDAEGASVPVEAAWAVDANGNAVPTHYELNDRELVQVVVPNADTAYPIVADPTWGWKSAAWGLTLNRSEVAGIKDYTAAVGMCAALVKKAPVLVCGAWAAYLFTQATTANRAKPKGCLHVVVAPAPGAILHVKC